MTKIVLIGCGQIAMGAHLPALSLLHKESVLELVGVCDADAEKAKTAAKQFNVPHHGTDWQEVVAQSGASAVSVCLPPGPNAEISAQALEAGLHVICEKPPGRNLKQAERMALAAQSRPELVNLIAFNRRFTPLYVKAIEHSKALGDPHVFYGRFTRPSLGTDPSNTVSDWITSDGSHALDLAMATVGVPDRVSVARQQVGMGADNVWTIQLHTEQGSAVLLFDFAAGRRVERFEWSGPGYDVLLELPDRGEWSQQGENVQHWTGAEASGTADSSVNYGFKGEYGAFADAIAGKIPRPKSDFCYGMAFMQVVQTILDSTSGELREVPKPAFATELHPLQVATSSTVSASVIPALDRPVVRLMQATTAQTQYFTQEQLSELAECCDLRLGGAGSNVQQDLADANVLVAGWGAPGLTPEQMASAENLKLVLVIGASVKMVQPEQLLSRQILLCNTADAIAQSVAEHCLLVSLAGLRRLTEVDRQMHAGGYPPHSTGEFSLRAFLKQAKNLPGMDALKPKLMPMARKLLGAGGGTGTGWNDLQGQVVGIIGWGYTARHFAKLLQPFNCKLLINSESISVEELQQFNARKASLGEVLGAAKVISLHKGLSSKTQGMIGARELAMIQPGSVLVNTARGGLIDEAALIAKAKQKDLVIALDVFHEEPLHKSHPIRKFGNVILTPHNASSTAACYRRVGQQAFETLQAWRSGEPIATLDAARLSNMT